MEFDQTDHIIAYLVSKMAPSGSRKRILTISLAKLLFLVDYEHFKAGGSQATDLTYVWYKYGPYPLTDFERRWTKLEDYEITRLPMGREIDGRPYNLFCAGAHPRFAPRLEEHLRDTVDRVAEIFKDAPWETLLQYVYSLDIVKGLQFGEAIDFGQLAKAEDEVFLETVARAFKQELAHPLSPEHMKVVQEALSEPTNENVETARKMLARQRHAFLLKSS